MMVCSRSQHPQTLYSKHKTEHQKVMRFQHSCKPLLGNSQLIPGMADFSQGVFHQSVGPQNIIIMVPIERNDIFHPILSGYTCL